MVRIHSPPAQSPVRTRKSDTLHWLTCWAIMRVALERTVMSPETYTEVCASAGLSVPIIEVVQRGLPRSLYSVCAVDKLGRTLGFAP